jgi:hypothetical protein
MKFTQDNIDYQTRKKKCCIRRSRRKSLYRYHSLSPIHLQLSKSRLFVSAQNLPYRIYSQLIPHDHCLYAHCPYVGAAGVVYAATVPAKRFDTSGRVAIKVYQEEKQRVSEED